MSLYVNNNQYMADIVIDRGLNNVNIVDTDIRPGKVSIDSKGNKLESASSEKFLSVLTDDGNIVPSDVTVGKIVYSNGKRLVGTASTDTIDTMTLINGVTQVFAVGQNMDIKVGDFVRLELPNIDLNRVAVQIARNEIIKKIKRIFVKNIHIGTKKWYNHFITINTA